MDAIFWLTAVLIIITGWYAFETRRMVKNMERDREERYKPILNFQLIAWEANLLKLRIQNVGGGGAYCINGEIVSNLKSGKAFFPWSSPYLGSGQYEEFGFPNSDDNDTESCFRYEKIHESVLQVLAQFKYKSVDGKDYELNYSIPIEKVTNDWIASKMLVTGDHPNRIMPRIAKTLENIEKELKTFHE